MSKYVNIIASTNLSTEFYLEVSEGLSDEEIRELAKNKLAYPQDYPRIVDNMLKKLGISIGALDSLMRAWDMNSIEINIIDNDGTKALV